MSKKAEKGWWVKHVEQHAVKSPLEQICRPNIDLSDFCVMVADISRKIGTGGNLLDIGAGNGLVDILLSPSFQKIVAVEPATETFCALQQNVAHIPTIEAHNELMQNVDLGARKFDHVLMYSVTAQLDDPLVLFDILESSSMYFSENCRILIGSVNDAIYRESYLNELPSILKSKGFADDQVESIVERNYRAAWHDYGKIAHYLGKLGFHSQKLPTYPLHLLFDKKFDVLAYR